MDTQFRKGHFECESAILQNLSMTEPEALLNRFATLVRSSGREDEKTAADYISGRLKHLGILHRVYEPKLYISLPVASDLQFGQGGSWEDIRCASPSFSSGTAPEWVEAQGVMTSATTRKEDTYIFDTTVVDPDADVNGKIALCEGTFSPGMVRTLEDMGAAGVVMINPGERIHQSNCSTVWGTPTLDNMHRLPGVPVVSITRPDGERLRGMIQNGGTRLRIRTQMDAGWRQCPLVVAEIPGVDDPESFILVHGHLDSWYYGICDNGTGNAALLELARVLHEARQGLGRSVRIAWWPGHSHGRYAGSTWYADHFAMDLEEHCIAQMDIDSPGAKWATTYDNAMFMDETAHFVKEIIGHVAGQTPEGRRPQRAGDYSFNNIGITSLYMSFSEIPEEVRKEKGFYLVGGNAGNCITWHTDQDLMPYIDFDILMQDLKIYAVTITRLANAVILPYDFRETLKKHRDRLRFYQNAAGTRFDLSPAVKALDELAEELERFYRSTRQAEEPISPADRNTIRRYNELLIALGRALIPVDYVNMARFEHDPAVPIAPLGRLEPIQDLSMLDGDAHLRHITANTLVRRRNQIVSAYRGMLKRLQRSL